jgi:hypothetical protein
MSWYSLCKALADYRRDRFESARDWANRAITNVTVLNECKSAALFLQASAYGRLNNLEAAGGALVKESHPDTRDYGEWPCDWAVADFLRREAQKQISGAPKTGDSAPK